MNDPLYNHPVFGPDKGRAGNTGKTEEQLITDLVRIHNAENWLGEDGEFVTFDTDDVAVSTSDAVSGGGVIEGVGSGHGDCNGEEDDEVKRRRAEETENNRYSTHHQEHLRQTGALLDTPALDKVSVWIHILN